MLSHFSAPSHPLIHAFLLRREEFQGVGRLLVETREQWEKLLQVLENLPDFQKNGKQYRLITTKTDILETLYDRDLVGIFPIETLDWSIDDIEKKVTLILTKGMQYSEELLITWLTDNGFRALKSDEEYTFFRQGDTVSVVTRKGIVRMSFFGRTLESIYLNHTDVDEWRFFSHLAL